MTAFPSTPWPTMCGYITKCWHIGYKQECHWKLLRSFFKRLLAPYFYSPLLIFFFSSFTSWQEFGYYRWTWNRLLKPIEGLEYEDSSKWNKKEEGWEANPRKCNFNRGPPTSTFFGKRSITMFFKPLLFWIFVTLGWVKS